MNSLKKMAQNEDEIKVITALYTVNVLHAKSHNTKPLNTKSIIYIHRVEEALSSLNHQCRQLIENDFINRLKPFWWKSMYSSRLYLHIREKAVGSFLTHFYED